MRLDKLSWLNIGVSVDGRVELSVEPNESATPAWIDTASAYYPLPKDIQYSAEDQQRLMEFAQEIERNWESLCMRYGFSSTLE